MLNLIRTQVLSKLSLFLLIFLSAGFAGAQSITTVAGGGSGLLGPAINAQLGAISGVAVDPAGNIYFTDHNNRVGKISNGILSIIAGTGTPGFSGDGGLAVNAQLSNPTRLAVDPFGNLFINDVGNARIRKVTNGIITTYAGNGTPGYSGDGGQAINASIHPTDLAVDSAGSIYLADGFRVRKIASGITSGLITTVAGTGNPGFSGDGAPPLSASFTATGIAVDVVGNLYIADEPDGRILFVCNQILTVIGGFGVIGFFGDGGPAINAQFDAVALAVDLSSNIYIADITNNRVRRIAHQQIATAAGNGGAGFSGDGALPTNAQVRAPGSVAVDSQGRVFIGDGGNHRIRMLTPLGQPLQFNPTTPCRVMDTRPNSGFFPPFAAPFVAGGSTRSIPILSSGCNIPSTAQAYSLNMTVVPRQSSLYYLTVWPSDQPQPMTSTLNSPDGSVIANAAIVPAAVNGSISVFASQDTDLIIDINGYYSPPSPSSLEFYPMTPCRVLDTRNPTGTFGGPSLVGGTGRDFPIVSGPCPGIPATAQAYSLNTTIVPKGPLFYLTAWPTGQPQPLVSTLNSYDGNVLANTAIVPAGANGSISFYASQNTDLVADINGYYAPPSPIGLNFYASVPCRSVDTRYPTGPLGLYGPILPNLGTRTFPLAQGPCGLPAAAGAYSLNVTALPTGFLAYLSMWPTGTTLPLVSTLNGYKGQAVANAAVVPVGTNGSINVFVVSSANVLIDSNGYFAQ